MNFTPRPDNSALLPELRQRLLGEWSGACAELDEPRCIHQLFEAQAAKTPDRVAVEHQGAHVTYRELNARADARAARLRSAGVGPEALVAICLERSVEQIVSALAVLKAGGAYVALDAAYPPDRIAHILRDSGALLCITQRKLEKALPAGVSARLVDSEWGANGEAARAPAPAVRGANPAYVIYTSGSTGLPKGVLISHHSLVQHALRTVAAFALRPEDRVAQFASFAFDLSVDEIFPTLITGATLVLSPPNAWDISALVRELRLTFINPPTALWHEWVAQLEQGELPAQSLRMVAIGGEAARTESLKQWLARVGTRVELINGYGPTETTVTCTVYRAADASINTPFVPIGRSHAGAVLRVLDDRLELVAPGEVGELYVGGPRVARGYLGRPDLTAERFIPDPYGPPGARLYKTGDLVRFLPHGDLEFLGRSDFQVKLRGFRIELGEVEAALAAQPQVRDVAVIAREDVPGDKRLVGYFVGSAAEDALRAALHSRLPEYMVPSALVRLEALPLSPNGKVDRSALPAPAAPAPREYLAPRTEVEKAVAAVWAQVLNVQRVGLTDDFFELGGHSIAAVRTCSLLRGQLGVELQATAVFEHRRLQAFAAEVELGRARGGTAGPPLLPRGRDGRLPLSFAQQRLWLLDQLQPGLAVYNVPSGFRFEGKVDPPSLQRALSELVARHEALRTTFSHDDGVPFQVVHPAAPLQLEVTDLRALSDAARAEQSLRLSIEEANQPFDLEAGPLFRARLVLLTAAESWLLVTMHHTVSDVWTMGVLARELGALYAAQVSGQPAALPPLKVQYADYASWQREWSSGERQARQLEYWKNKLAAAAPLELPTDRPRPPVQSHKGAEVRFVLPPHLFEAARALAQKEGTTAFITLLAAVQALLHRCSGQSDICVGSPVAGRHRTELEGVAGFFENTVVMRSDLSDRPTFRQLLRQVRQTALEAYANQDVPFEKLVEVLRPERTLSRSALFQVMFSYQEQGPEPLRLPEVTVTPFEPQVAAEMFDLTLVMREEGGQFAGLLSYATDLYDEGTISRLVRYFGRLLEEALRRPDVRVDALPMLSDAEHRRALFDWNDTFAEFPRDALLFELFDQQARKTPDALAVVAGERRLTYRALYEASNRLGHLLRSRGATPNTLIPVVIEKSLEQVVAVLGILKAGAAYVPVDPNYPPERFSYVLQNAEATLAVTLSSTAARLSWPAGVERICLDDEELARQSDAALQRVQGPEDIAYVIFTSGSTGRPKGVVIDHRGPVNTCLDVNEVIALRPEDRVLAISSLGFDLSVWDLFGTFAAGAALVMPAPYDVPDPHAWAKLLEDEQVTVWNSVPALMQLMVDMSTRGALLPKTLRAVMMSGDWIPLGLPEQLRALLPGVQLISMGGATEASIWSIIYPIDKVEPRWKSIPYGRPMKNQKFFVLNEGFEPVPVGVPGDLFIGGIGLAKGYWRDPEKTAASFLVHPKLNERIYRTGDLGQYFPDGVIEFLGRKDFQVKVNGFRIELGEIEAALLQHGGVKTAVVSAVGERGRGHKLVAYVVPTGGPLVAAELGSFLEKKLPGYMVPATFIQLPALPLSSNGKVDRKALPRPELSADSRPHVAPRSDLEARLCAIFAQVLKLERAGVTDNFFDLGGHSLLAASVIARVRDEVSVDIPLRSIFEAPTVEALATRIVQQRAAQLDEAALSRLLDEVAKG